MSIRTKILSILGFLMIIISLILAHNSPAKGYEVSIYTATPTAVWVLLILSICIGTIIIIGQAFGKEEGNGWVPGFLLLITSIFVILIMAPLRGYFAYDNGDPLVHIGMINNIIRDGHVEGGNFYPLLHIMVAAISQIFGLFAVWSLSYLNPLISLMYIASVFLIARLILPKNGQAFIALVAGSILFYGLLHISLYPNSMALLLIPLIFYFYFRGIQAQTVSDRILLILLLILYPFLYAPVSFVITISLIAAELMRIIIRRRFESSTPYPERTASMNPALISFIMLFLWSSSFVVFDMSIANAWSWLRGEAINVPFIDSAQGLIFPLGFQEVILMALKIYGDNMAVGLLSVIAALLIIRRAWRKEADMAQPLLAVGLSLVSGILAIVLFFTILSISVGRLLSLNYAMWIMPVLVGFILYELFGKRLKIRVVGVTAILVIISIVGIFGLYRTPFVNQPSPHLTYSDMAGNDWVVARAKPMYTVTSMGFYFDATADLLSYEPRTIEGKLVFLNYRADDPDTGIPEHFGYSENDNLGSSIVERFVIITKGFRDVSIMLNQPDNTMYSTTTLGDPRFNERDFNQLELDSTVARLYSNQGTDVYYVSPSTGKK